MGGEGSGRKPDPVKTYSRVSQVVTPIGHYNPKEPIVLPDYSGVTANPKVQNYLDQRYLRSLFASTSNVEVTETTTETSIIGTGEGSHTIPANFLEVGDTLVFDVGGFWNKGSAGAAETFTWTVKIGSTTIGTLIQSVASAGVVSERSFNLFIIMTVRTIGSGGTAHFQVVQGGITGNFDINAETTIDTTATNTLDVTMTMNNGNVNNVVTGTNASLLFQPSP